MDSASLLQLWGPPFRSHLPCRVECAWSLGAAQIQCSPLDPAGTGRICLDRGANFFSSSSSSTSAGARPNRAKRQLERKRTKPLVESEKIWKKELIARFGWMDPPTNSISSAQHGGATLAPVIFHLTLGGEIDAWSRRGLQFRCPACDSARFIHFWCISRAYWRCASPAGKGKSLPSAFHPVVAVEQTRPAWSHEWAWIRCTCLNSVRMAGYSRL